MDFQLSPQLELLRKSVREFAEGAIAPKVQHMEETDEVPWELYKELAKQMYLGILIPKEFGGTAFGNLARMIMLEEIGRVSAAMAMATQIFQMGTASIVDFGNEAQKKKYLPALARGERLGTIAVTEATGGSDPTGIQTTAKLQGDSYVLNGRKCFITHGHVADTITIMAKTGEGPKGFSAFIVEKSFPGFKLGRKEKKFGLHGCNTGEIVMENCIVPRENLLGNEGDGLRFPWPRSVKWAGPVWPDAAWGSSMPVWKLRLSLPMKECWGESPLASTRPSSGISPTCTWIWRPAV